jgi:hypothetical protein
VNRSHLTGVPQSTGCTIMGLTNGATYKLRVRAQILRNGLPGRRSISVLAVVTPEP